MLVALVLTETSMKWLSFAAPQHPMNAMMKIMAPTKNKMMPMGIVIAEANRSSKFAVQVVKSTPEKIIVSPHSCNNRAKCLLKGHSQKLPYQKTARAAAIDMLMQQTLLK